MGFVVSVAGIVLLAIFLPQAMSLRTLECHEQRFCSTVMESLAEESSSTFSVESVEPPIGSTLTLRLSDQAQPDEQYILQVFWLDGGGIRVLIVDRSDSPRFVVPDGDVYLMGLSLRTDVKTDQDPEFVSLLTDTHLLQIQRAPFSMSLYSIDNSEPKELLQSINSRGELRIEAGRNAGSKAIALDHVFNGKITGMYGLAEHSAHVNLLYRSASLGDSPSRGFNLDIASYPTDSLLGLYGTIPLLYGSRVGSESTFSGFLWVNPSDTYIHLPSGINYRPDTYKMDEVSGSPYMEDAKTTFVSETGAIDFVMFTGETPAEISASYRSLTGSPAHVSTFAMGHHQCKWGYQSQQEVERINSGFTSRGIPLDVMWMDLDYSDGKKYMTWDTNNFPDPDGLVRSIAETGRRTVIIIDPHIKAGDPSYFVTRTFDGMNGFIKDASGKSDFVGECWPGMSKWADFDDPAVRHAWSGFFSSGVSGNALSSNSPSFKGNLPGLLHAWNDMNEPSVFSGPELTMPKDSKHLSGREHREVHGLYGMYFQRSTFEGLRARDSRFGRSSVTKSGESTVSSSDSPGPSVMKYLTPDPLVLTRSFFIGSHRYGAAWLGDTRASWEYLQANIRMLQSMSLCHMAFVGGDVGGFDDHPSSELMTRWHQWAAMTNAFYRTHASLYQPHREPWEFPEPAYSRIVSAIKTRYSMMHFWFNAFAHWTRGNKKPMARPIIFDFPADTGRGVLDSGSNTETLVGDGLLVLPIAYPEVTGFHTYFPGQKERPNWRRVNLFGLSGDSLVSDLLPDREVHWGGTGATVAVNADSIPVFVKGGTFLPLAVDFQGLSSTDLFEMKPPLTLVAFLDQSGSSKAEIFPLAPSTSMTLSFPLIVSASVKDGSNEVYGAAPSQRSVPIQPVSGKSLSSMMGATESCSQACSSGSHAGRNVCVSFSVSYPHTQGTPVDCPTCVFSEIEKLVLVGDSQILPIGAVFEGTSCDSSGSKHDISAQVTSEGVLLISELKVALIPGTSISLELRTDSTE